MRVRTPLGNLPWWAIVCGNALFWPAWTAAVGYLAERVPSRAFESDDALTRFRRFEQDGDWYRESLLIHAWKDRLPEAGAVFGGFAKRNVQGLDVDELTEFVVECRRAEYAHWVMSAGVLLTHLWNPRWAFPVNVAVAAGSNMPCIGVQRYNRARLTRTIARMRAAHDSLNRPEKGRQASATDRTTCGL